MSALLGRGLRKLPRGARVPVSLRLAWASTALFAAGLTAQPLPPDLHKAPPDSGSRAYGQRLAEIVKTRYPELFTRESSGVPIVTVLLNADGTVARTSLEIATAGTPPLTASEAQFAQFGLVVGQLEYLGVGHVELPHTRAVVIYGGADSRDLDRALVERFFPKALTQRAPPDDELWILFDRDGHVLLSGEERVSPGKLASTLETRFPGIRTAEATTSVVYGRDGLQQEDVAHHRLTLNCIWLAMESPLPRP